MTAPMIAAGLDLGGTKIETQVFDSDWQVAAKRRVDTPATYDALIRAIADQIAWADAQAEAPLPVGIGAAGLIHPVTGNALTANLPASGKPLPNDIRTAANRPVTYLNDCRAMALSEAVFGAGRGHHTVMALILGTGVGGGVVREGKLHHGPTATGGEFGHCAAPAHLVLSHGLPVFDCGCGAKGCIETYISGNGLQRLSQHLTGQTITPHEVADARSTDAQKVWDIWIALCGDLLRTLILTNDPDVIVLGGGLSKIDGLIDALSAATQTAQFAGFTIAPLALAEGGDASGARGAAYAAWQAQ